jgi:acid phosphatase class B
MKDIILCDIDGTIANNDHRQHFLEGQKDWEGFFLAMLDDVPIQLVIDEIIQHQLKGKKIIFLTGRPERYREQTEKWLKEYFNFPLKVLMRKDNDLRHKVIAKQEILEKNKVSHHQIFMVYENDEELISFWKQKEVDIRKVKI